ncbi:MAG: C4-dicarboxylate ABC transporter [Rhizobiaceae bacterium MnEN-MB40S]|nr:MAG: C4-dicarboxylate ABC transporter [Rhizobiaceae bacterium MnEN-MB40S]
MMKTITAAAVFAAAAIAPLATAGAQTVLRLACPSAPTNPTCQTASRFAEDANSLSNGALDVQVFPSGQLGKGKEAIQQTQAGIIDLVVEDISNYGNFVKDYNIVSWGFAFRDEDHFEAFLDSDLQAAMAEDLRKKFGLRLLSVKWAKLPRVVVSTKPVFTPDDVAGLKFRVPGIPSYIKTWETVGANPASVPWGESFQALKTGVVDAMESPFDSVVSQKFHLAAPYVTRTDHVFASITLAMNEAKFQGLTDEQKAALEEAAAKAADFSRGLADESAESVVQTILGDGGSVIMINVKPFQDKLQEAVAEQEDEGLWSKGLMEKVQAIQ